MKKVFRFLKILVSLLVTVAFFATLMVWVLGPLPTVIKGMLFLMLLLLLACDIVKEME